jgi:hypothetical protein
MRHTRGWVASLISTDEMTKVSCFHVQTDMSVFLSVCLSSYVYLILSASTGSAICINAPEAVPTRGTHTQMGRPVHTRYQLVSTRTQTHTNTNKRTTWPDKVRCGLTPWQRPPHQTEEGASPPLSPHPQQAASLSLYAPPALSFVCKCRSSFSSDVRALFKKVTTRYWLPIR